MHELAPERGSCGPYDSSVAFIGSSSRRRRVAAAIGGAVLVACAAPGESHAQWVPRGALAAVPVVHGCDETGGDVAVSRLDPPAVYVCDRVVRLIRARDPGAEHFYFVHEFGHVALQTSSEAAADCWAARELVAAPNGSRTLRVAIAHFRSRGDDPSARYGSPRERAERIRSCADDALPGWDAIADAPASRGHGGGQPKAASGVTRRSGEAAAR